MENDNQPERDSDRQPERDDEARFGASRNKLALLLAAVVVLLFLAVFFYLRGPGAEPEEVTLAPLEPRATMAPPQTRTCGPGFGGR